MLRNPTNRSQLPASYSSSVRLHLHQRVIKMRFLKSSIRGAVPPSPGVVNSCGPINATVLLSLQAPCFFVLFRYVLAGCLDSGQRGVNCRGLVHERNIVRTGKPVGRPRNRRYGAMMQTLNQEISNRRPKPSGIQIEPAPTCDGSSCHQPIFREDGELNYVAPHSHLIEHGPEGVHYYAIFCDFPEERKPSRAAELFSPQSQ
jgi:hypothetical protein